MYLTGKGIKKAEGRPSGESRLVCKVSTDHCMHPPLGGAPRDQGFLPRVRSGKCQVLLSKTPPNHAMQPPVQHCWSMWTPQVSTVQQTQGTQAIHPDGGGQYKNQVQRSHLRRGRSPSHGAVANWNLIWKGSYLMFLHWTLVSNCSTSVSVFPIPLCQRSSKIHGVKLLGRVSREFMCWDFTSQQLQHYPKNSH